MAKRPVPVRLVPASPPDGADARSDAMAAYSSRGLGRAWKAERFSWSLTRLMHRFPEDGPFERAMRVAELDYIGSSKAAQSSIAENHVGLPIWRGTRRSPATVALLQQVRGESRSTARRRGTSFVERAFLNPAGERKEWFTRPKTLAAKRAMRLNANETTAWR